MYLAGYSRYSGISDTFRVKIDKMRQVIIVVYPGVSLGQLTGMAEIFRFANELAHFQQQGAGQDLYQVQYYQLGGGPHYDAGPLQLSCCPELPASVDCWLIPGSYAHMREQLLQVTALFSEHAALFRQQALAGSVIGAGCNGTFALAATGLLDGGLATTCWFLADYFQQTFQDITLDAQSSVRRSGVCLTAGASTAYIQLCLQIIADQQGSRFASQLAKLLMVEPAGQSQAPFLSVQQLLSHQDEKIANIQQYLRQRLAQPLELSQLASEFAMSSRTLSRRFKAATGLTPMAWLQKLRIDKAKQLLENTMLPLEQLTLQVGYEDVSSFRKLFQQYTQMTPKAYRAHFASR